MNSVMTINVNPALVALLLSVGALWVAWLTFRRAGDWRESDAGKETAKTLSLHNERLIRLETRLEHLATKADIAELKGNLSALKSELDGVRGDASAAAAGVVRIENFLIQGSE